MAERLNTTKFLENETFYQGGLDVDTLPQEIKINVAVSDQYDYSVTEDPVLLQERKDTEERLYEIYMRAPFYKEYQKNDDPMKIPKEDIIKVFSYMKEHLQRVKTLSAFETVIAITEFFDFNYDYVVKKCLSPHMMAELLEDYYTNMGMASKMNEVAENPLF